MKIITTTVIRHSIIGQQASGHLLEVDWARQRITQSFAIADPKYPTSNTNPRGGLRGGRGVKIWKDHYYVANYDSIYVYDSEWRLKGDISHPLATDVHEIDLDEEGIWLSCSRYDMALKLNYNGDKLDHWHISDNPSLMRTLGVDCKPLDLSKDYRRHLPTGLDFTHLNCVQIGPDNTVIVNLGQIQPHGFFYRLARRLLPTPGYSAHALSPAMRSLYGTAHGSRSYVVSLDRTKPDAYRILSHHPALRPNHNGQLFDAKTTVLASESGGIVLSNIETGRRQYIPVPGTWVRGFARIDERRLLVGIQPCAIVEIDIPTSRVTRHLSLSDNPNESVHGLTMAY